MKKLNGKLKRNKLTKQSKGITLIALVITIIVLLILAGVTIATLTGDNGLLRKTIEAKFKSEIKQYEEELRLSISAEETETLGNRTNIINVPKKDLEGNDNENYETDMVKYIPSFDISKYGSKLEIRNDELVYIDETNREERKWFGEVQLSLSKYFITVNYIDKYGNELAESETISTATGLYEVEPKLIEGYEAELPLYEGKTKEDTQITITYLQESGDLAYIGLDESKNETDIEENIVAYTVSGIGNFTGEDLVIPRKHNNKPITNIKISAFSGNSVIKIVIIPETIQDIGNNAFDNCSKLMSININAKKIGGVYIASGQNLKSVYIGNNVEYIGIGAFSLCSKLEKLMIYTDKADFNCYQFQGCILLNEIIVNDYNNKYKVIDNVLYSKDEKKLYMYPNGKVGEFKIPRNVEIIGTQAFRGNIYLNELRIDNNVKKIEFGAFEGCTNINTMYLNAETVEGAACRCPNLEKLYIGADVKNIGVSAFGGCKYLEYVKVDSEKVILNSYQFDGCTSLKDLEVSQDNNGLKTINGVLYSKNGQKLYMYAPGRTEEAFSVAEETKSIYGQAFRGNKFIKEVNIPSSVTEIEYGSFAGCSVKQVNYGGTLEEWNNISKNGWNAETSIETVNCIDQSINL